MSRIIIKNIPNGFDEVKVRNHFSTCGIITDVQLKYTPEGKFRNFGFIGYENEDQATKAIDHFNNSFIRTSKITVAPCVALSETKNLKVWSKHAKKVEDEKQKQAEESSAPLMEKPKPQTAKDVLGRHENDPMFKEFLEAHQRAGKSVWDNKFEQNEAKPDSTTVQEKSASEDSAIETDDSPTGDSKQSTDEPKKPLLPLFVAKLNNLPHNTKRQDLIRFFKNTKPFSVRIPRNNKGFAYVGYKMESDLKKALLMNKSFLGGKQIKIYDFTAKSEEHDGAKDDKRSKQAKWERQKMNQSSETICESGKLFFRNLAYSVKEEEIRELFEQYGPVVEVDVPIDSITRKVKGFGTATFLMPEHAVMAYNELNGTFLQGRMFHILPAVVKDDRDDDDKDVTEGSNYKKKKEQMTKKSAQSTHNWNTLFMGANAVAEAVSRKYGTTKEKIFISPDGDKSTSAAVRLALGETEIVLEMQKFLEDNDIRLDSFGSAETKRSNTVILAKNLAPACTVQDLRRLFAPFGILGRVVMPPSAVTAVIEFLDPSEARKAFKKLAYTIHQSLPLYLEWAPENTFKSTAKAGEQVPIEEPAAQRETPAKTAPEAETAKEEPVDDTEPEEGTTLFIKNLSFTTVEETIRQRFRNVGAIHSVNVVRSKDLSGNALNESRGYGFIQFKLRKSAEHALKNLQFAQIDGRPIELARSDRTVKPAHDDNGRKKAAAQKQTGNKILVRNIPFQANSKEVRDLFKVFGDIQSLRLPKKMAANADENHRGFCFVEFVNKPDAKRAFDTLGRSTHLYGRRLVLEWATPDDGVEELRKRTAEQFGKLEGASAAKRSNNPKSWITSEQFVEKGMEAKETPVDADDDDSEGDDGRF